MKFSRRKLLLNTFKSAGALSLLSSSWGLINSAQAEELETETSAAFAIFQGLTNSTSTQFTVHFSKKNHISYHITNSQGKKIPHSVFRREVRKFSPFAIEKIFVDQLSLSETYTLQVIDDAGKVLDERIFQSLDLNKVRGRFVVGSCMKDSMAKMGAGVWQAIAQNRPDFIILSGDTCYANKKNDDKDEVGYWRRYSETRQALAIFRHKKLIPIFAIWDDHDFGINNGDGSWKKKNMVKEIFEIFWDPQPTSEYREGPGVSAFFTAFGQRFCLMDGRFFKSSPKSNGSQWGEAQEQLLMEQLQNSQNPAWIVNGILFFGGYFHDESFEKDHNKNFKSLMKKLSQAPAPVCFVSGDIHYSELMEIEPDILGYRTYEFVSSSLHSSTYPFMQYRSKNPRRLDATSAFNFMLFESEFDLQKKEWVIDCKCLDSWNERRFAISTTIKK